MNGDMSPYTIGIFRQTNFSQEAIRLTAGDGGPSAGCQTHSNAIVKMLCQNKTQK